MRLMSPLRTLSSCGSSSSEVRRRKVPKRVRRSSPSTPPGAGSCGRGGGTRGRPEPAPWLAEEDRAADRDQRPEREQRDDRRREEKDERRDDPVDDVLEREVPALRVGPAGGKQRQAADVLDGKPLGDALEEARHEGDGDAELLAALDLPQQDLARRRRERDDDVLDPVLLDEALEVPARAEDRHRQAGLLERLLVEEADRLEAELRMLEQTPRGEPADAAGAEDQRRLGGLALAARLNLRPAERDPARAQVDRAEGPEADRLA